jgi:hypothetical protein
MIKQVEIRHINLIVNVYSLVNLNLLRNIDKILQMANSWDKIHLEEMIGGLIIGSSVVMVHPEGTLDVKYVLKVVEEKEVSLMQIVPLYLNNMLDYLLKLKNSNLKTLRNLNIRGLILKIKFVKDEINIF